MPEWQCSNTFLTCGGTFLVALSNEDLGRRISSYRQAFSSRITVAIKTCWGNSVPCAAWAHRGSPALLCCIL
eukprot:scaffold23275_cov19-Tisochrysis_lutea.AAC.7